MLGQLRLSNTQALLGLVCGLFAYCCHAEDKPATDVLAKYRSTETTHGLYEIREEAHKFLKRQPKPKDGNWSTVGPDIRVFVPLCAVPLRTRWVRESDHEESFPGVLVICDRSTDKLYKKWDVCVGAHLNSK